MRYRKKPVEVSAVKWTGDNLNDIADLIGNASNVYRKNNNLSIRTLEGTMTCSPGDWLIKGVKGEFYPCKPDIFTETYEPVGKDPFANGPVEIIGKD